MTELEKALKGKSYNSLDKEIMEFQSQVKKTCYELNHLLPEDPKRNETISDRTAD